MDYKNGKIYRLVCNVTGLQYIGSTTQPLSKRMYTHKSSYKRDIDTCSSKEVLDNGDFDIILIENFPCENKEELHKRERYYIESTNCVNKRIPTRGQKEYDEYYKENFPEKRKAIKKKYYDTHQEKILEYRELKKDDVKQYREDHKEHIDKCKKEWYEKHKDDILKSRKELYDKNKEVINAKRREKYLLKKQNIILDNENV
jgi:hypothetical protein